MNYKKTVYVIITILLLSLFPQFSLVASGIGNEQSQTITGISFPRIDGFLDDIASDLSIGEWEDALQDTIFFKLMKSQKHLLLNQAEEEQTVQFKIKYVDGNLFVAIQFPKEVDELAFQFDIDNDGELSDGDVRVSAQLPEIGTFQVINPKIVNRLIVLEIYKLGTWVNLMKWAELIGLFGYTKLLTSSVSIAVRGWDQNSVDPKTTIEIRFNPKPLEGLLKLVFPGLSLSGVRTNVRYGMTVKTKIGRGYGYPSAPIGNANTVYVNSYSVQSYYVDRTPPLPAIDLSVDKIEVTQAVQTSNTDLTLVRGKQSLARVYVNNPISSNVEVDVKLHAYTYAGSSTVELGMISQTFLVPASFDRTNLADSANFELPDDWISNQVLLLEAEITPTAYRDTDITNNKWIRAFSFRETHNLNIYYVRVNEGTDDVPWIVSTWAADTMTSALADSYPVANPNFIELGWETIGAQGDDWDPHQLALDLADLQATIAIAIFIQIITNQTDILPLPDQIFGMVHGGGGLSTPSWYENGQALAAWGSLTATSHSLVMAHEINHNLGSNTWGRHIGNPDEDTWGYTNPDNDADWGCGASGPDASWPGTNDNLNQLYFDTLGWRPGTGLIAADKNEIMSYCNGGNPRKWISDYRWEKLVSKLDGFVPSLPTSLRSLFYQKEVQQAIHSSRIGLDIVNQNTRIVSGFIHKDGFGSLNPSYTTSGSFARPPKAIKGLIPTHYLIVEYLNGTIEYPLYPQFDLLGDDHPSTGKSTFHYWLPDDGTLTEIRITDALKRTIKDDSKNDVLLRKTGWKTSGRLYTPTEIIRGKGIQVRWDIDLSSNTTNVYSQLQYTHDGRHWYNLGKLTTDTMVKLRITELPGGTASFRLIVTNGFDSQIISTSDRMNVPKLRVKVKINRKVRSSGKINLGLNEISEATTSLGSLFSLSASAYDPQTGNVKIEDLVWTVERIDQPSGIVLEQLNMEIIGDLFNYQFTKEGTYRIKVSFKSSGSEFDTFDIKLVGGKFISIDDFNKFMSDLVKTESGKSIDTTSEVQALLVFPIWLIVLLATGASKSIFNRKIKRI